MHFHVPCIRCTHVISDRWVYIVRVAAIFEWKWLDKKTGSHVNAGYVKWNVGIVQRILKSLGIMTHRGDRPTQRNYSGSNWNRCGSRRGLTRPITSSTNLQSKASVTNEARLGLPSSRQRCSVRSRVHTDMTRLSRRNQPRSGAAFRGAQQN